MNLRLIVSVLVAAVSMSVASVVLLSSESQPDSEPKPVFLNDFTYSDISIIQEELSEKNIVVSNPTEITDYTVKQYCTFSDDKNKQESVKYCMTTAVIDPDGKSIGNINMGGSDDYPVMALAIIEASPFLDSNVDEIKSIFSSMVDTLVCDCWDEKKPGNFESVTQWIDTAEQRYLESGKKSLKSTIDGLDNKKIILEISSTDNSFLWILIILK